MPYYPTYFPPGSTVPAAYPPQPDRQQGQPMTGAWASQGWSNQPHPTAQLDPSGVIVRPVASYDEAKAVPTDFSGALTIMPDWAHSFIYAKAMGDKGTPVFRAYRDINAPPVQAAPQPVAEPAPAVVYAPLEELQQLRQEVNALREELASAKAPAKETAEKTAGKGNKT